jgi:putative DNA primase/helicase
MSYEGYPHGFADWPPAKQNQYFAEEARKYDERIRAEAAGDSEAGRQQADTEEGNGDLADRAELERLAHMPALEYARARKSAAKRLGVPVSLLNRAVADKVHELGIGQSDSLPGHALDLPAPQAWPEPVDGAELLDDITAAIERYVVVAEHSARACALWILHTYFIDCFLISPRLAIRSVMHRCGKTTLLDVVSHLALRTLPSANVTAASVFRVIEACRPTLLIDEADTFLPKADELRGVINSGHRRGGAVVRTVGDDHEPRKFSTYAPCAIALIGKLPATLHDRSAPVIDLKRRLRSEDVENFRVDRTGDLNELARKAARWATDNAEQIQNTDPKMPVGLFNRDADNWRPLLAIAEAAGGQWPEWAREAAELCCMATGSEAIPQLAALLSDIRALFISKLAEASTGASEIELPSKEMVERLIKIEGRPWAEMGKTRKPLTPNRLARILSEIPIAPSNVGPEDGRVRGYRLSQFKETFDRFLDPLAEDQLSRTAPEGGFELHRRTECDGVRTYDPLQSAQPNSGCAVENGEKANKDNWLGACAVAEGVAGEKTPPPQETPGAPPAPSERRPNPSTTLDVLQREASLDGQEAPPGPKRADDGSGPLWAPAPRRVRTIL